MDVVMSSLLSGLLQILHIQIVFGGGCFSSRGSCCILCNPGYFMPLECGPCKPCPVTGYTDKPNNNPFCDHCRRCEGIFIYTEKCTSTRNAACTCIPGKKCTNEKCKQCINDSCPAGQQLVGPKCMTCPLGTFNTGAAHICTPWTNCSALGGRIIINGTHTSDVVCGKYFTEVTKSPGPSSAVTTTTTTITNIRPVVVPSPGESHLHIIYIGVSSAVGLLFIAICVACHQKLTERIKHVCQEMPKPRVKQTQEEDGCSCHFPEEENGGENEPMTLEA